MDQKKHRDREWAQSYLKIRAQKLSNGYHKFSIKDAVKLRYSIHVLLFEK